MLPEVLAERLLQGQKAIHHLELTSPPSRRVMFRKRKSRGGWEGWGPSGQRVEVSIFYIFLKKNQTAPRSSEHPPVMGEKCQNV